MVTAEFKTPLNVIRQHHRISISSGSLVREIIDALAKLPSTAIYQDSMMELFFQCEVIKPADEGQWTSHG